MFAEIAYDWEHVSWRFQVVSPAPIMSSSRVFAFVSSVGPQSGQPRFQELVSCNIIPGSLGSKILPCTELLGDHSFLHSFPKEEKNGFKVHTAG